MAVKASNQVSLVDITDAYSVMLTSEAFTFVGDTSGAPSGLSCATQAVAYRGSTQCSNVSIGTITCPTGISATISNNNTESPTITFKTTATITAACEATIPVVVDGITINKKFSFAVAMKGDAGNLDDLNVTEKLNSELKVDGNSIALTTGHFTIDAENMKLDANGNAEFIGDVKAESFEFKDSLDMGFGQWGSKISLFRFGEPMNDDTCKKYNIEIPPFHGKIFDSNLEEAMIEGLEVRVPTSFISEAFTVSSAGSIELYSTSGIRTTKDLNLSNGVLKIYDKEAIKGNDAWLRLNNGNAFSNGVYTPGKFQANGEVRFNNTIYIHNKIAIQGHDNWLRLNNDKSFTNGVYTPGFFRADEGIYTSRTLTADGGIYWGSSPCVYTTNSDNRISSFYVAGYPNDTYFHCNTSRGAYGISVWASDTKLKENITPTNKTALDKVNAIEFIQFDWKSNDAHVDLGVSANQIEEFMPDAVYDVEQDENAEYDTLKNIDTGKMTTYALKAIQELSAIVDKQSEIISKLESRIRDLEDKLKTIS